MGIFKALKRVMSGTIVKQIDVPANEGMTTVSVRLKRDGSGQKYVVIGFISTGNYQYCSMDIEEFKQLYDACGTVLQETAQGRIPSFQTPV